MIEELLKTAITVHFPRSKISRKGWMTSNCPLCVHRGHSSDKKGRMGIKFSQDGIGINCFNCFFHAKWVPGSPISKDFSWFLKIIGVSDEDIKKLKFQAYREKEAGDIFKSPELDNYNVFSKWVDMDLPKDSLSISTWAANNCNDPDFLKVCRYAYERKMYDFDNLYWTPLKENQFNKRIIIPCFYNKKIVGFSARFFNDDFNKKLPKYLNFLPDDYIYNLDSQEEHGKYCILCEGMIDAMLIGGISCIGNSINQKQINILKSLDKLIILCPDRDEDGQPLIDLAMKEGWDVSFPKWEGNIKDPAAAVKKYGKILTLKTIIDSRETNPLKIHVSRKFDNFRE